MKNLKELKTNNVDEMTFKKKNQNRDEKLRTKETT